MEKNIMDLLTYDCAYHDGKLFCITRDFNLLFSVDIQDGNIELVDIIPKEDILTAHLAGAMTIWNGKLILTPGMSKKIWIYDLVSKHWEDLPVKEYNHWGTGSISQIYEYKNKLFLIGGSYPAILCLDLEHNTCDYIEEPYKEVMTRLPEINFSYFRTHGIRLYNNLYLASCLDNFVLKFNMDTMEYQWIKVGNDKYMYSGITWDGNYFWLSPRLNTDIVKWDGKENVKVLSLSDDYKQNAQMYVWGACYDGRQIIFPSSTQAKSILMDIQKDCFHFCEKQYPLFTRLDNGMVVSQTADGYLSVRTEDSPEKIFHISVETDRLKQFYEERNIKIYKEQTLYTEIPNSPMLSLDGFLKFTSSRTQRKPKSNGQVGKAIWDKIQ